MTLYPSFMWKAKPKGERKTQGTVCTKFKEYNSIKSGMNGLKKKRQKQTRGPHHLMHSRVVLIERESM